MLHINKFYVTPEFCNQDIGSMLINKIEEEAKTNGAIAAHVDTFDVQAKDFYLKQGYEVFGVIENCPDRT